MSQQPAPSVVVSNRIWTIPNVISFIRLLGVPIFLYLLLGPEKDVAAVIVLAVGGTTDWVDGFVARRMNSVSRLGELLDPFADRLYILATLIAFVLRDIIPWWLAVIIVGRDLVLAPGVTLLRRHGYRPLNVSYVGKAATFCLLYAFPLLLIGSHDWPVSAVCRPIAWAFVIWGTALYLVSGATYAIQLRQVLRADRAAVAG